MAILDKLPISPKVILFVASYILFVEEILYGMVGPITPTAPAGIKDEHMISTLYGAYAIGLIISTPVLGLVTDRVGRRKPMIIGTILLTLSAVLFCIGINREVMFVGRILEGMGAACVWTAGMALVAEYHVKNRVQAMGFAMLGATTGSIIGPLFGGEMCEWLGYRNAFIPAMITLFIGILLSIFLIPRGEKIERVPWKKSIDEMKGIVSDHAVLSAALAVALAAASWALMEPLFPMHLIHIANASTSTIGLLITISNLLYAFLAPMVGFVSDRVGVRNTAALGLLMTAVVLPLLALSPNIYAATTVLCLITISYAFTINPTSAELGDAVDRRGSKSYAVAYAVYNLAYSFGMIGVDTYIEFVTDEAHKLQLLHILLIMSGLFLICIPIFTHKPKKKEPVYDNAAS